MRDPTRERARTVESGPTAKPPPDGITPKGTTRVVVEEQLNFDDWFAQFAAAFTDTSTP